MKNQLFSLGLIAFLLMSYVSVINTDIDTATSTAIKFEKKWNDALALAKKENKLIYLNIHASWCGPCKKMKRKAFSNIEVGRFYNKEFINISLDGEIGEGIHLSDQYNVDSYPSHIFIDSNEKIVIQTAGYHTHKGFIKLGQAVLNRYNQPHQ